MKNGKAAWHDGIPSEALKVDVEATAEMLLSQDYMERSGDTPRLERRAYYQTA